MYVPQQKAGALQNTAWLTQPTSNKCRETMHSPPILGREFPLYPQCWQSASHSTKEQTCSQRHLNRIAYLKEISRCNFFLRDRPLCS